MNAVTDDLLAFLRARLDEDERIALNAPRHDWTVLLARDVDSGEYTERRVLDHVMQHDPLRVLREVEAKRRIISLHEGRIPDVDGSDHCWTCVQDPLTAVDPDPWPCTTLRLLALPYADREGYREEWRP